VNYTAISTKNHKKKKFKCAAVVRTAIHCFKCRKWKVHSRLTTCSRVAQETSWWSEASKYQKRAQLLHTFIARIYCTEPSIVTQTTTFWFLYSLQFDFKRCTSWNSTLLAQKQDLVFFAGEIFPNLPHHVNTRIENVPIVQINQSTK